MTTIVFVDETEFVIVERLGRFVAVYDRPQDRGWQWKAPWPIDQVRRFDARLRLLDPPGREVFTSDRKNLVVQAAVCWRIAGSLDQVATPPLDRPVVRFFRGLQTPDLAETRLGSRLQSVVTTQFARWSLADLLTADNSEAAPSAGESSLERLTRQMIADLHQQSDETESWTQRLGLEVVDVRIRRLNFPAANQQAVFERMRSERQKIAERYRSAGQAESTLIRSQADRQAREALALAESEAARIRSTAEAESLRTLNDAYRRDPEFAERLQALDAYRTVLNDRTTLILSADSPIWRFLLDLGAKPQPLDAPLPASPKEKSTPPVIGAQP
ncbi:MAG: protease modulator HflC [Planctomycetaceae bacterium]|nr:protease modulator HflC [Planctomycetaceae bacterium]